MKKLFLLSVVTAYVSLSEQARALEPETLLVRGKFQRFIFSGVEPSPQANGFGIDVAARFDSTWGLNLNYDQSFLGSDSTYGDPIRTRTEMKTRFIGAMPTFSVSRGIVDINLGVGFGGLLSDVALEVTNDDAELTTKSEQSNNRFAWTLGTDIDVEVYSGLLVSGGLRWVQAFGKTPRYKALSFAAGLGYKF